MKKIYIVRHGESEGNAGNFMQSSETGLSKEGELQSMKIAAKLKKLDFDLLISSPYKRTIQTAELINYENEHEIFVNDLFRERQRPSRQYGLPKDGDLNKKIDHEFFTAFENDEKYEDGESFKEVKARAIQALDFLNRQEAEKIVVVTHGTFARILAGLILLGEDNLNPKNCLRITKVLKKTNTGISSFIYENDFWRIYSWNDFSHIS